ncbi:MAG: PIN domain-containing protein [Nanoarchaeota archaeon]
MRLVIDANIFIAALIAQGRTLDYIYDSDLQLFAPQFLLDEIHCHKEKIRQKTGLDPFEFMNVASDIISRIHFTSQHEAFLSEATRISPDPDDAEYLAVALMLQCPIWSNDKRLKEQKEVKVLSTHELLE